MFVMAGHIHMLEDSRHTVIVNVGEFILQTATISKKERTTRCECTCGYDGGGYCSHIVAALLYMIDEDVGMKIISNTTMENNGDLQEDTDELNQIREIQVQKAVHAKARRDAAEDVVHRQGMRAGTAFTGDVKGRAPDPGNRGVRRTGEDDRGQEMYRDDANENWTDDDIKDDDTYEDEYGTGHADDGYGNVGASDSPFTGIDEDMTVAEKCVAYVKWQYNNLMNKNGIISVKDMVSFEGTNLIVQQFEQRGNYKDAAEAWEAVAKYVSDNIVAVNNTKHHYTRQIQFSVRKSISCIKKSRPSVKEKKAYMTRILESYLQEGTELFAKSYIDALYQICKTDEDAKICMSLFEKRFKSGKAIMRRPTDVLEAQIPIMEKIGGDTMRDFLNAHYKRSERLWTRQVWYLVDLDIKQAVKSAVGAAKAYPHSKHLADVLCHVMGIAGDSRQTDVLRMLFVTTWNWVHYEKLKDMSDNWDADLSKILEDVGKSDNPHMCIDVLLHEGGTDEAFKEAMGADGLHILDAYRDEFFKKYPAECYKKYADTISDIMCMDNSMYDDADIRRYVESIKSIPRHQKHAKKLLASLKKKHPQYAGCLK